MKRCGVGGTVLLAVLAGCGDETIAEPDPGPTVIEFSDHREVRLTFEEGGVELAGSLYVPLGDGPFTTLVEHQGSSGTVRAGWSDVGAVVTALNVAFFSYDRRGHGASGGVPGVLTMDGFAADLAAATREVAEQTDWVQPGALGLMGASLGGWIVPLTANLLPQVVNFAIVAVGGAVSSGQEALYDELTGYGTCDPTNVPLSEITDQIRAAGPSGFDPKPSLEQMAQPTFWLFGGNDLSHPTNLSIENLNSINADGAKDWTITVLENANHSLIEGGTICQDEGQQADFGTPMSQWFGAQGLGQQGGDTP